MDLKFLHVEAATPWAAKTSREHRPDAVQGRATPLPTLIFSMPEQSAWPSPPIAWGHAPPPPNDIAQTCSIEIAPGKVLHGEMRRFDPVAGNLTFASDAGGELALLEFSSFRRLTLTSPLRAVTPPVGGRPVQVLAAAQMRDYVLHGTTQAASMTGRTAGYVEAAAGLYLFTPIDEGAALQRVFVPRCAYSHCEFGPSAQEIAARLWIGSPTELLDAIERQERMPVLPIGQSLLALGLLTSEQLNRELAKPASDRPLGEALVAAGLISHTDLQTAIAHKLGYPLVDLTRFPVDLLAVTKVPKDIAVRHHMLPLMIDQGRLIVAVDRPSRVMELRSLHLYARKVIVPVLASAMQITVALDKLSPDVWAQQVVGRPSIL